MKTVSLSDMPNSRLWKPVYGRFNFRIASRRLEALALCDIDPAVIGETQRFIENAFNDYGRKIPARKYGFVFAIPTRINRLFGTDLSEARHFLPIVDYLSPEVAQIFLSEMPPCVLDEYYDREDNVVGAIVFVPLFSDMIKDMRPKISALFRARKIIKITARYVKDQLQPDIVGLGATLPKLTRFGKDLERVGLRTTTGHGGTVYLIYKMFDELQALRGQPADAVGIIGAGAIGASTAALLLDRHPGIKVSMYDIRRSVLQEVVHELNRKYPGQVFAAASNNEVIQVSSIIVSAITSTIRLSHDADLSGKFIIDDSQPGSFSREDVEAHGGKIVWVVGTGLDRYYHRKTNFMFGDNGLLSIKDVWGCEAELTSIWNAKAYDNVINSAVTPEAALRVGKLMDEVGIARAAWQMAGQSIDIRNK